MFVFSLGSVCWVCTDRDAWGQRPSRSRRTEGRIWCSRTTRTKRRSSKIQKIYKINLLQIHINTHHLISCKMSSRVLRDLKVIKETEERVEREDVMAHRWVGPQKQSRLNHCNNDTDMLGNILLYIIVIMVCKFRAHQENRENLVRMENR